jgi:8-oxo-dGTP pyrophosphatase MutT (NUDIX family)
MPSIDTDEIVLQTPWFQIFKRFHPKTQPPYYGLLLVRQFRPIACCMTLELPAGHIEPGETPEQATHKELAEETGYEADHLELLCRLSPSTARFTNQMWVFFAQNVYPTKNSIHAREHGVEAFWHGGSIRELLDMPEFCAAGAVAALFAAVARGKIQL